MPVILPFFIAGAVDGIGVGFNALSDVAAGVAGAAAYFLYFFILAAVGGTASMGGMGGSMMMTSIFLLADSAM